MPARRIEPPEPADVRRWEQRVLAAPDYSMSLPVFVGDMCLVAREVDGCPVIMRLPPDGDPAGATVLVDPRRFAQNGEELSLQRWGRLGDGLIFFGLADAGEDGILRFLDPVTGRTVGPVIPGYRNDSVVLCEVGGTPVLYYGSHPVRGTPGKAEWWARVGGLDGRDVRLDIPAPPADPPLVPRPEFTVHSHGGRQWLVVLSASGAGDLNDIHVAELSAPGSLPERPLFTQSLRTTVRTTGLGIADGKATFVSTLLGEHPQGTVFRAPLGGLCNPRTWNPLITSDRPGAHINSVVWAGEGRGARLLVRRTYDGRDYLDVHDRRGARLFTLADPPNGTNGLLGVTSRTVGGTTTAYLKWGSLTTAGVYAYELGGKHASVSVWEPWSAALEGGTEPLETVTHTWRADYGGTKAAVGELTRLAGTGRNRPPLGTLIVFYSSFGTPQSTPSLYGGPQRWADAWVRAGGQVLSILTQDPVDAATRHDEADAVIAVLETGVVAGLLEGRTNVLTGFSAAATTVARVANRRPDLVRVAASLHGWLSNGSRAAAVGVGPNTMLPHGLGFPTDGPGGGPVERLAASTRSPSKNLGVYLATGMSDTRVDPALHAGALDSLLRQGGLEPLVVTFEGVGHASGTTRGVVRQWPTHLAVFARHLAGVRRPGRGTPVAQTAADVVRRRVPEETTVKPSREVRATMAGYADTTPAQLTGRLRKVGVRTHRSGGAAARPGRTGGAGSGRVRERAPGASGV